MMVDLIVNRDIGALRKSVSDNVYDILKHNIINWILTPGDRISEKEISEFLKVSRTPVRESFIKLSNDGLLDILPQRGSFISRIDMNEVDEGLFIRRTLETAVLNSFKGKLKSDELSELRYCLDKQKKALKEKNPIMCLEYDEEFHSIIFSLCHKSKTWSVIKNVNTQYNRMRMLTLMNIDKYDVLYKEHMEIFKGLETNDHSSALSALIYHLEKIGKEEQALKNEYPQYFI